MFKIEIQHSLYGRTRREVDRLIYNVWTAESLESGDVDLLVSGDTTVLDPLDALSTHVLVRDTTNKIIGYGRVAIASNPDELRIICRDETISEPDLPLAYISRLVVDPAFRGQGIASLIHKTRIDIARAKGAAVIYGWAVGEKPRLALSKVGFVEGATINGFTTNWYTTARKTRLVKLDLLTSERSKTYPKKDLSPARKEAL